MTANEKWIIDTNVIVHWLMQKQIMPFAVQHFHLANEFFETYSNRHRRSFDYINQVLGLSGENQQFLITELSLSELFLGIRDEIRCIMLFIGGVPIARWQYKRESKDVNFSEELSKTIYELTLKGFDSLFGEKRIEIIPVASSSEEKTYFDVYSSLIFLYQDLRTQDALLITTAIFEKANYFVTTDSDLVDLGKKLRSKYGLQILLPDTALQIINHS